jgi:hypothetical protein
VFADFPEFDEKNLCHGLVKLYLRLTFASTIHPDNDLEIDLKARVAQLVEHDLAKVGVASSNLVSRSTKPLQKGFVISGHF